MAVLESVKNNPDKNVNMMALDEKAFNNLNLQWLFLVLETQG